MLKNYSIKQLSDAEWFPYKAVTIRKFIKEGGLEVIRYSSCKIRVTRESVERFLSGGSRKKPN